MAEPPPDARQPARANPTSRAIDRRLAAVHYVTSDAAAQHTAEPIKRDGGRLFAIQAVLGALGKVDTLFASLERSLGVPAARLVRPFSVPVADGGSR